MGTMLFRTLFVGALVACGSSAFAEEFHGKVVGVSDGDTISVTMGLVLGRNTCGGGPPVVEIRLQAVDCPEKVQPFGTNAKQFTSEMVFGKAVTVKVATKDRYGRTVAWVDVGGEQVLFQRQPEKPDARVGVLVGLARCDGRRQ